MLIKTASEAAVLKYYSHTDYSIDLLTQAPVKFEIQN
jgi:hypothetical protein